MSLYPGRAMRRVRQSAAPAPVPSRGIAVAAVAALPAGLLAGLALATLEIALVFAVARDLFLSALELARFVALSATLLPATCAGLAALAAAALDLLARGVEHGGAAHLRRLRYSVIAASAAPFALALWLLTSGRRVRVLPGRGLLVVLTALAAAWAIGSIVAALARAHARAALRVPLAGALLGAAALALALDATLLRRLYPAFHFGLALLGLALALAAAAFAGVPARRAFVRGAALVALVCGVHAVVSVSSLVSAPNARFAIREAAPLSGKLLALVATRAPVRAAPTVPPPREAPSTRTHPSAAVQHAGIDLHGRDVLLVTVDALRADRLRAYGGSGVTPAIDALAAQSVVFLRAYTPTPHTSYAISSLFTGKFMQPLLSLAETVDEHPTLPQMLRRHGYRTAAFYPPAIFFVDEERFEFLSRDNLGFEYVKSMFASAEDRVAQLDAYLTEVPQGFSLFVWVHLFEPHEPYDPPPAFARGETPVERYDGEVAAADAAIGRLIARFRAARPDATVVLSADHGEEFGDHGGHHHGTALYDEHVRVPLLWSSPGQARPRVVHTPVEILDVTTTLLAALGIPREARMRGDDLSPVLAGAPEPAGTHAFSSIEGQRMWTDGRHKLICGDRECRLFDLVQDPGERRDLSDALPEVAVLLREQLDGFVASLPKVEALAMRGGGAWPEALARARLGDASAGPELVPLLSSARADVRAAAARALGALGTVAARNVLSRMRASDSDADVAAESAVAALRLGDLAARAAVQALLARQGELARRAALALAAHGDMAGEAILIAAARDRALEEPERLAAIRALAPATSSASRSAPGSARDALVELLSEVRLRPEVASALGRLGDRRAARALEQALRAERYPEARRAEARALLALGARRAALALTRRFLGTEVSVPDGVGLLREALALTPPSGAGADLATAAQLREGEWQCEPDGCRPLAGATLALPRRGAPRGPARAILRARVQGISRLLRVSGQAYYLNEGEPEIAFRVDAPGALVLQLEADPGVWLQAIAVVPVTEEIPPPAPSVAPALPGE